MKLCGRQRHGPGVFGEDVKSFRAQRRRHNHAFSSSCPMDSGGNGSAGNPRRKLGASGRWYLCPRGAARSSRLRATSGPRAWLHLGSGLLGVWAGRILLGSGNLGTAASRRRAVDSRLLGLGEWTLCVASRLLGTPCGILRRNQLRVRIHRSGLCRRILEKRRLLLQPVCDQRECNCDP
jgi:hypothetical protein